MTLAPGTKLGPYEILSPIGAGGRGLPGERPEPATEDEENSEE